MGYLQKADDELNEILKHLPIDQLEQAKRAIKTKILESYRNGLEAGKLGVKKSPPSRSPRS